MAPPLYFLPDVTPDRLVDGRELKARVTDGAKAWKSGALAGFGLDRLIDRPPAEMFVTGVRKGPGERPGLLLCCWPGHAAPPGLGYFPESQSWHAFRREAGDGALWIGLPAERPTPADLARDHQVPGGEVELAGGSWTVPILHSPDGHATVPTAFTVGGNGEWQPEIEPAYRDLWERSGEVWDAVYGSKGSGEIENARLLDFCVDVLAVNYRVDRRLAGLLRLITTETWAEIVDVVLDYSATIDRLKKKRSVKTSSGSGSPD